MKNSRSRLNLTQLTTLRAFVRHGTLAAAADQLGYTPGAVSQHVSALEGTLDTVLVRRSGRQLILTDAGRVLADYADQILSLETKAMHAVASVDGRIAGPLTVGTWGSTAAALLAPVIETMANSFPDVIVRSREVDLDEAATAVRHGEVDVAFGLDYVDAPMPRDDGIAVIALHEENFEIAVAAHRYPEQSRQVGVGTLAEMDWILPPPSSQYGRALRTGFRKRGFEPRVVHEVTDTAACLQLAAAGLGATVLTDLMLRLNPSVQLQRLQMKDPLARQIVLITPGTVQFRQTIAAFTELVTDVVGLVAEATTRRAVTAPVPHSIDSETPMRTLSLTTPDGFGLAAHVSGRDRSPALLLLPGQANSHVWWTQLRGAFEDRFRVLTFDYRGTGDSRGPIGDWSTVLFAGDAAQVVTTLAVGPASVYGTSFGGRVAQMLAIAHPETVDRLALACTSPGGSHAQERSAEVRRALAVPDPDQRRRTLHQLFYTDAWPYPPGHSNLLGDPTMTTAESRAHLRASATHDAWDRLPSIAAPTLVLHGTDDLMVPAHNAELIATRIPEHDPCTCSEHGRHGFFEEFADTVTPAVMSFL